MKLLFKIATKKTRLPILNTILVKNGMAWGTDCDTYISHPCDKPDGLYDAHKAKIGIWQSPDGMAMDDWPVIPNELVNCDYSQTLQTESLKWVSSAISQEESRYYLCGVYFDTGCLVATDGHALKRIDVNGPTKPFIMPDCMVESILASGAKDYRLHAQEGAPRHLFAHAGDYTIISKAVDANFPDYSRVIPSRDTGMPFDTNDFKVVLKRVKELDKACGMKNRLIRINQNGNVEYAGHRDVKETLCQISPIPLDIGFNCELIAKGELSGLAYFGIDAREPLLIIEGGKTFVIMPVRI